MTAPGNSTLLVTLLAVFVACCGYAAGRVHQRRHTGRDREEAYRDGYDTATRSVFSLAARAVGPRRTAARASAPVAPALAAPAPVSTREPIGTAGPGELSFPLPLPPPSGTLAEPAAVGGVTYQPFPDPRPAGESGAVPGGPRRRRAANADHRAVEDDEAEVAAPHGGTARTGRHTVPEELVQAATYLLPPDRVFRAKVRDAGPPPAGPGEDPASRHVPKPRQS